MSNSIHNELSNLNTSTEVKVKCPVQCTELELAESFFSFLGGSLLHKKRTRGVNLALASESLLPGDLALAKFTQRVFLMLR